MKKFVKAEHDIIKIFSTQKSFKYDDTTYDNIFIGKPTTSSGEPKTDIFLYAESVDQDKKVFIRKISLKLPNHDFLENKITAKRAEEILGTMWSCKLRRCLFNLRNIFLKKKLVYKRSHRKTDAGSFTLGWKIEFVNKKNGELSAKIPLSRSQIIDIYSGRTLEESKRNASVNGYSIKESGVADYILVGSDFENIENILDNLISVEDYAEKHPDIYLACKALNYRSFEGKYDGNRPLGVYVQWKIKNSKLTGKPKLNHPLEIGGDEAHQNLKQNLDALGITTTNDINGTNTDPSIIFE